MLFPEDAMARTLSGDLTSLSAAKLKGKTAQERQRGPAIRTRRRV